MMEDKFSMYSEIQELIVNTIQGKNHSIALKLNEQNDRLFAGYYTEEDAGKFVQKNDPIKIYNIEDEYLKECISDIQVKMMEAYGVGNA